MDRFAVRLGALLKAVTPEAAARFASQTFDEAADLQPEEAAEIFACEMPPAEVGAPGD